MSTCLSTNPSTTWNSSTSIDSCFCSKGTIINLNKHLKLWKSTSNSANNTCQWSSKPSKKSSYFFSLSQNKGFFYPCGRDKLFRPILVFNCKLIDWKNVEENVKATVFVHQMIIEKMLIPGQVESWIVIYDLGGMGLS